MYPKLHWYFDVCAGHVQLPETAEQKFRVVRLLRVHQTDQRGRFGQRSPQNRLQQTVRRHLQPVNWSNYTQK